MQFEEFSYRNNLNNAKEQPLSFGSCQIVCYENRNTLSRLVRDLIGLQLGEEKKREAKSHIELLDNCVFLGCGGYNKRSCVRFDARLSE